MVYSDVNIEEFKEKIYERCSKYKILSSNKYKISSLKLYFIFPNGKILEISVKRQCFPLNLDDFANEILDDYLYSLNKSELSKLWFQIIWIKLK